MHRSSGLFSSCLLLGLLASCGGGSGGGSDSSRLSAETGVGPASCLDGRADGFPCRNMGLAKLVPLAELEGTSGNDIWGWTDPLDNTEYALMGLNTGTTFVQISDPNNPVVIGHLPTETVSSSWRDIKVYANHAYIVSENAGAHGMQVFDLTRLRTGGTGQVFSADIVYTGVASAHNVVINESSGYAYIVGEGACAGGLHMVDIREPLTPLFAGCHSASGYSHDAQCVNYTGPDSDHSGAEICFGANESYVAIVDVSDKASPNNLSAVSYPNVSYTHQAWLDETHTYLIVNDELDERTSGVNTSTMVFDVSDLDAPQYLYTFENTTSSIDHNLYIRGNRMYQANYTAGLRIVEFSDLATDTFTEVAFFDTHPESEADEFEGAWSVYPFFESGTIIVSDINRGLFVLTPE